MYLPQAGGSEIAGLPDPALRNGIFASRFTYSCTESEMAEKMTPVKTSTRSRSMSFFAFASPVATFDSVSSMMTLRGRPPTPGPLPTTPPDLLISSTANWMPSACWLPIVEAGPDSSQRAPMVISSAPRAWRGTNGPTASAAAAPAPVLSR